MKRVAAILTVLLLLCALAVGCQSETYTLASGVYYPEGADPAALSAPSIWIDGDEFRLSLNPLMSYAPWGTVSKEGNFVSLHCVSEDFSLDFRLIGDNKLKLTTDPFEQADGTLTDGMVFILWNELP